MLLIILFRVHTEFWTQNSRLFPAFFPIHESIFPDSRLSNRWSIETFEKMQEPSFFHGALQTYCNHGAMGTKKNYETSHSAIKCPSHGRDWIEHREKIHWSSTFCSYKKTSRLWIIFLDFISIFKTFSGSWKSRLFHKFMTPHEPYSFHSTADNYLMTMSRAQMKDRSFCPYI